MAQTPSTSRLTTGRQTGSQPGQGINNVNQVAPGGYNGFDKPWNNFITPRFAEITPFFYTDTVGKSKELLINTHQVRAYTMSAPNMQEIRMHKSYYAIPKEAIMRNTWEYWFRNPKHGDDVPPDSCYPGFSLSKLQENLRTTLKNISPSTVSSIASFESFFRHIGILNLIFSKDSLFRLLGASLPSNMVRISVGSVVYDIDTFIDSIINLFSQKLPPQPLSIIDSYGYTITINSNSTKSNVRHFFLKLFTDSDFSIFGSTNPWILTYIKNVFGSPEIRFNVDGVSYSRFVSLDLQKAYQMTVAQFFSNSDVDDIYEAKMWEDNSISLIKELFPNKLLPTMSYNGTDVIYDSYAQAQMDEILSTVFDSKSLYHLFSNILCIRRSLVYRDYFYGARLSPLAVGDANASVNSEKVSAIDITKSIVMQRFLNAVNKVPGDILSYLKGIFGYEPLRIPPQPVFLAEDTFGVSGELVANTTSDVKDGVNQQGNLVYNISFRDSDRGYEAYIDCESFILGFVWYDYIPAYVDTTDRLRLMNDRFDFFQPFLQTIGDQPILGAEATSGGSDNNTISWQTRNMEYKQRFNRKVGGFIRSLPGWTLESRPVPKILSPNDIRNENIDIDSLFSSLTGCSLENYFHFIMSNHNAQISNLPMLRQPGIL